MIRDDNYNTHRSEKIISPQENIFRSTGMTPSEVFRYCAEVCRVVLPNPSGTYMQNKFLDRARICEEVTNEHNVRP